MYLYNQSNKKDFLGANEMKRLFYGIATLVLVLSFQAVLLAAPRVDALLTQQVNSLPLSLTPVVITFNTRPTSTDFLMLRSLGITGGQY